ncbi:MAG: hypothetical protein NWE92_07295 [Candidatus Bathyarchaeota archaeon]|nr:hypothetical protein [Candidatus Bathyarchaeota archaeon]
MTKKLLAFLEGRRLDGCGMNKWITEVTALACMVLFVTALCAAAHPFKAAVSPDDFTTVQVATEKTEPTPQPSAPVNADIPQTTPSPTETPTSTATPNSSFPMGQFIAIIASVSVATIGLFLYFRKPKK